MSYHYNYGKFTVICSRDYGYFALLQNNNTYLLYMKRFLSFICVAFLITGCGDDKKEKDTAETESAALAFETEHYEKKSEVGCSDNCPAVTINVPVAEVGTVAGDSINKKLFNTVRSIVFFGEKPYTASNYDALMASFLESYEELRKDFPNEALGWEAKIDAEVTYITDSIINITMEHYTYTGGAHGYAGNRSLLFDPQTGKSLTYEDIFTNAKEFTDYAEQKFREKFKIPANRSINATGLLFEDEVYALPLNIFFKEDGLLLYYNAYEIASYAEQQKELLIPYSEADKYLKRK